MVTAEPTRSSNDLNALEFLTSPNLRATLPPNVPIIPVVFSPAIFTASDVFWYLPCKYKEKYEKSIRIYQIQKTNSLNTQNKHKQTQKQKSN